MRPINGRLGLEPDGAVNPEEIVALGAAVWASQLSAARAASEPIRLRDVIARSYGVEVDGGAFIR
jgi:molecular chaperone DnaK (HSP70)